MAPPHAQRARTKSDAGDELRLRAAWIYYMEGETQSNVAAILGVNRITVTRLLSEARRRGEVTIQIKGELASLIELQRDLEKRFGLERAIVAPVSDAKADPTAVIAAAAGAHISALMRAGLTIGVGWGRTLHESLPHIEGRNLKDVRVVSLLGGIMEARRFNPAEFAWRFAELFEAEGYLIPAPALVDSADARKVLLDQCGLEHVFKMAQTAEIAVFGAGGISEGSTTYKLGHLNESERKSLTEAGAVGDVLYNFIDGDGVPVNHPINDRVISVDLESLANIPQRVLVSGGSDKTVVIKAAIRAVSPTVLVTDELTARSLLKA
ncbi:MULTISPECIES: sugar-binding transcriptional regulator [Rhodobacterales]|uniref:sugar-binding transcriptional regulator n=1 Tax=Roseobacter sp. N2S TaxID=2663844 RepID=UPI0028659EAC|nr:MULTISPECIES: sugar-binding transcriptional regulator [Rhodobacterales]MDR6265807.1 DNA-binding transcriptional regulator LsrR (DeoR family) [Roseobacter sp. N2S]